MSDKSRGEIADIALLMSRLDPFARNEAIDSSPDVIDIRPELNRRRSARYMVFRRTPFYPPDGA